MRARGLSLTLFTAEQKLAAMIVLLSSLISGRVPPSAERVDKREPALLA